jgi:hypothetical protein
MVSSVVASFGLRAPPEIVRQIDRVNTQILSHAFIVGRLRKKKSLICFRVNVNAVLFCFAPSTEVATSRYEGLDAVEIERLGY